MPAHIRTCATGVTGNDDSCVYTIIRKRHVEVDTTTKQYSLDECMSNFKNARDQQSGDANFKSDRIISDL